MSVMDRSVPKSAAIAPRRSEESERLAVRVTGARGRAVAILLTAVLVTSSFAWARFVLPSGTVLPVQRVVAAAFLLAAVIALAKRMAWRHGPIALYLFAGGLLLLWIVSATIVVSSGPTFEVGPALMDLSKYGLNVLLAGAVAVAVVSRVLPLRRIGTLLVISSTAAVVVSLACFLLYFAGFRFIDGYFLRTFGDAWGVWPSSGVIPRVAGPAAEPQQLSILFVTGVLIAAQRRQLRYHAVVISGVAVLLLSQSKFSLVSILVIGVVWLICFLRRHPLTKRGHALLGLGTISSVVALGAFVMSLPTFQQTVQEGFTAQAFTERANNATLLLRAFIANPVFGIGPGQYGSYRSRALHLPVDNTYYPNNDYMKVLAETGLPGILLLIVVLGVVAWAGIGLVSARRQLQGDAAQLATGVGLGVVLIALNMFFSYELLHVFLWIDCGLLVGLAASQRKDGLRLTTTPRGMR